MMDNTHVRTHHAAHTDEAHIDATVRPDATIQTERLSAKNHWSGIQRCA